MPPIRVLVTEDSLTIRRFLCDILAADPDFEVVGEAADGRQAIELCHRLRPDVVTMDMMLPVMTGLAATEHIMAHCPTPILVVSASMNRGEVFKTYEALAAGALDVLEKPLGEASEGWDRKFTQTVKLISRIKVITHPRARLGALGRHHDVPFTALPSPTPRDRKRCEVVAIGASTGGPGAIVEILRELPASFTIPILLVLHIAEPFGTAFAEWLDGQVRRRVSYPRDGDLVRMKTGEVVMAPPESHLVVRGGRLWLTHDAERHSCRPSVDVLFESVALEYGPVAAACLLTGMGRDGATGLLDVRRSGGFTIAQDEATSVVYGMPREAMLIGAAETVLPLPEIAPTIAALSESWPVAHRR